MYSHPFWRNQFKKLKVLSSPLVLKGVLKKKMKAKTLSKITVMNKCQILFSLQLKVDTPVLLM